MAKKIRSLAGLPVILSGRKLGRVAQAALSKDLKRLEGIWVDAGLGGTRFISSESIQVLGEVSILVDSPGRRRRMNERPLFRRVLTLSGERLGAVTGAEIDEMTFCVVALEITEGWWEDLLRGRRRLCSYAVNRDTEEVVADSFEKEGDFHEGRNGEGTSDRRDAWRRGGDDLRSHELED